MHSKSLSSRTTRWGVGVAAAATAAAMCVPATEAQLVADEDASAGMVTMAAGTSSGFDGRRWGDATTDAVSKDDYGRHQAQKDPGSLFTVVKAIGARGLWAKKDKSGRPLTGQGVGVAVLDSGVANVAGLDGAGKVIYGPDLSIEANGVLTQQDTFGHGTFMAGIIAGRGATNPSSDLPSAPANVQLGVAPDAKLLADEAGDHGWQRRRVPSDRRAGLGDAAPGICPTAPGCGSSTCPTARTRLRITRLTRCRPLQRTRGNTESSWSPRQATMERTMDG